MRVRRLLLCALLFASTAMASDKITIYFQSTDTSTYLDTMGDLRGKTHGGPQAFVAETMQALRDSIKQSSEIWYYPDNKEELSTSAAVTAFVFHDQSQMKASDYKWVGPLLSDSVFFLENKLKPTGIKQLDDVKALDAICVRTDTPHKQWTTAKGITNTLIGDSYNYCWQELNKGNVSLTALSMVLLPSLREQEKAIESNIVVTNIALTQKEAYLAFSLNTPDEVIQQWQVALDKLKNSMMYRSLIQHYYCQQDCY